MARDAGLVNPFLILPLLPGAEVGEKGKELPALLGEERKERRELVEGFGQGAVLAEVAG